MREVFIMAGWIAVLVSVVMQFPWYAKHVSVLQRFGGSITIFLIGLTMIFSSEGRGIPDDFQWPLIIAIGAAALCGVWPPHKTLPDLIRRLREALVLNSRNPTK